MLNQSCVCSASQAGVWQVCWQMSRSLQPVLQGLWSHLPLNESHLLIFGVDSEKRSAGWIQGETLVFYVVLFSAGGRSGSLEVYCADHLSLLMLSCVFNDECQSE